MNRTVRTICRATALVAAIALAACALTGCKPKPAAELPAGSGVLETANDGPPAQYELETLDAQLASYKIKYYKPATREEPARDSKEGAIQSTSNEPFEAIEFGPSGELPSDVRLPVVFVSFSRPVIPLAKLGEPIKESTVFKIDPPLKGVYRWLGTKMLSFQADEAMRPLVEYKVSVDPGLKALDGTRLAAPCSFSFYNERLRMSAIRPGTDPAKEVNPGDCPPAEARRVLVTFNYPVDPAVVSKGMEVKAGEKTVGFSASRPKDAAKSVPPELLERQLVLDLSSTPPENVQVLVILKRGAKSDADGRPLEFDESLGFHTLRPFVFADSSTYSYSFPRSKKGDSNPIFLMFSHPVDAKDAWKKIAASGGLAIAADNVEVYGRTVRVNDLPVKYETTYTFTVDPSLKDVYGRALGKTATATIEIGGPARFVYIPNRGARMVEASFPPKLVWEMQDPLEASVTVGKLASDPLLRRSHLPNISGGQTKKIDVGALPPHTKHFETIDLKPYVSKEGTGWVGVTWKAVTGVKDYQKAEAGLALQVTDLAATTRFGANGLVCLVSRISTGEVVPGAEVALKNFERTVMTARTDGNGLAEFRYTPSEFLAKFPPSSERQWARYDLAVAVTYRGDRIEYIPADHDMWRSGIYSVSNPAAIQKPRAETFLFTDRRIYRPGEILTFRGIDRTLLMGAYTAYEGTWTMKLVDSEGETAGSVSGSTTESGGFTGTLSVPDTLAPGECRIEYKRNEGPTETEYPTRSEPVTVSYFRRLIFEASISAPELPAYQGDELSFGLSASYLAGGALAGATYDGYWTREPASFKPDGARWAPYRFGPGGWGDRQTLSEVKGSLNQLGKAAISQKTTMEGVAGLPYRYRLNLNVTDTVSAQAIGASKGVVVHPAEFYVGARMPKGGSWMPFLGKGETGDVEIVLAEPGGAAVSEPVTVKAEAVRYEWKMAQQQGVDAVDTRWERVETVTDRATVSYSGSLSNYRFKAEKEGEYVIVLTARDRAGREAVTKLPVYVTGSEWIRWRGDSDESVSLLPDKERYAPGDTAKVILASPLPSGTYLVNVEREGILDSRVVKVQGSTAVIDVPIKETYLPVVYVTVSSWSKRSGEPSHTYYQPDLDKPKGYFGVTALMVDSAARRVSVDIKPDRPVYAPGQEARIKLSASLNGKPVKGAELTFMAVDRGVVDIVDYHVPDPVAFFYDPDKFPIATQGGDSRSMLIDPVTYEVKDQIGGDAEESKMAERKDFRPTAVFEPALVTGADGTVEAVFTWPDNLTTYRLTAVAVKDDRFGLAESDQRVSNPINVKAVLPRGLRERDTALAGVIATNLDDKPHEVTVRCSSTLVSVDGVAEKTKTVEPRGTVEFAFRLAADKPGKGEIVFTTSSDVLNERLREPFEVRRPYIYETVATIGSLPARAGDTAKAAEGVVIPSSSPDGAGALGLSLASSRVPTLSSAVDYVFRYPYGCLEQRTSALLPLVAFGEYADAFGLSSEVGDVKSAVSDGMAYLKRFQQRDGGFGWWPESKQSDFYVSLRVGHLVALAGANGYQTHVDKAALAAYLQKQFRTKDRGAYLGAYATWVLAKLGAGSREAIDTVVREADAVGFVGWCFAGLAAQELGDKAYAADLFRRVSNYMRPAARGVDLSGVKGAEYGFYGSKTEALSLYLMLSLKLAPESDMNSRIVDTLVAEQKTGYWHSTAETWWALQAFRAAVDADGSAKADFTARATLAGATLAETTFKGLSGERDVRSFAFTEAPLNAMKRDEILPLEISREGNGALYYAATLRYAIPVETAKARDEGLSVYSEVLDEHGKPLKGDKLVKGRLYRMRVVVSSNLDRTFVAIRAPVPSGCDLVDTSQATSVLVGPKPPKAGEGGGDYESGYGGEYDGYDGYGDYYYYDPYSPLVRLYDAEACVFFDRFRRGTREYSFYFRAVAKGVYPTPPASAECMYEPEVFGRDIGRLFLIDEK